MKTENIKDILPIDKAYQDALSPAMKQIGGALESVAKTARFLLAPIDYLAAHHDRWQRYLSSVAEKVDKENLIDGRPEIVIPLLENLTVSQEGSILTEFYINLLSCSIDATKQEFVHPAFPNIIKQLSRDEAVILYFLKKGIQVLRDGVFIVKVPSVRAKDVLQFPQHIHPYANHLYSLNLITNTHLDFTFLSSFGKLLASSCIPDIFEEIDSHSSV